MSMNIMLLGAGGSGGGSWDSSAMGGSPTVYTFGSYESFAWKTVGSHTVNIPGGRTVDIAAVSYTHLTLPTI